MQNVVIDSAGHIYVCGEDISASSGVFSEGADSSEMNDPMILKIRRNIFPVCSGGWQFFQILIDNLTLKKARRKSFAVVAIVAAVIWVLLMVSVSRASMMSDLSEGLILKPEITPAVQIVNPPLFSIFTKDGKLLIDRAYGLKSGIALGPIKGVYFYRYGTRGFIRGEDNRIEPELLPVQSQLKVGGPRK
jgi:hypothetical protein